MIFLYIVLGYMIVGYIWANWMNTGAVYTELEKGRSHRVTLEEKDRKWRRSFFAWPRQMVGLLRAYIAVK